MDRRCFVFPLRSISKIFSTSAHVHVHLSTLMKWMWQVSAMCAAVTILESTPKKTCMIWMWIPVAAAKHFNDVYFSVYISHFFSLSLSCCSFAAPSSLAHFVNNTIIMSHTFICLLWRYVCNFEIINGRTLLFVKYAWICILPSGRTSTVPQSHRRWCAVARIQQTMIMFM